MQANVAFEARPEGVDSCTCEIHSCPGRYVRTLEDLEDTFVPWKIRSCLEGYIGTLEGLEDIFVP